MHTPGSPALERLAAAVAAAWPLERFADVTSMVAVSGGADSVGLLRTLAWLLPRGARGRLVVLHFDHRLRGEASAGDARFVAELAHSLGLECEIGGADDSQRDLQSIDEAALRAERYAFFDAAAHRCGARYLATAHTADDNAETVLHNLFRGTGPAGLAGIPPFRPLGDDVVLVRPLLQVGRGEIRAALAELAQPWREDASNADPRWQRNWIRGALLPEIRSRYPAADAAVARLSRQQAELLEWLQRDAAEWAAERLSSRPGGPLRIATAAGLPPPRIVVVAALREAWDACGWPRAAMAERHWNGLAGLIAAASSPASEGRQRQTLNLPGALRAKIQPCGSVVVAASGGD